MNDNIIINGINRIILVSKDEYPEKKTVFTTKMLYSHELIYSFSGNSTVYFNDQVLSSSPNTIRFLPAGICQKYIVDRDVKGECIDVFFTSNQPLSEKAFILSLNNEKLAPLFRKMFSVWIQKDEGYYLECISILYKILAEMQKTTYIPDEQFNKIKPAIEYIRNNFLSKEIITAEKLSSLCKISYSYVKKIFALKYKTSPKRYILQLKMNYACDLLRHNEYSISQIAEICGYSDIYTFSHQFKKEFGLSPTEFAIKYTSSK